MERASLFDPLLKPQFDNDVEMLAFGYAGALGALELLQMLPGLLRGKVKAKNLTYLLAFTVILYAIGLPARS